MYPKTPGYINHCPATLCYKLDCLFLELLVVLPSPTTICHLTPPKVIFYLSFQVVRHFGGTSLSIQFFIIHRTQNRFSLCCLAFCLIAVKSRRGGHIQPSLSFYEIIIMHFSKSRFILTSQ